MCFPTMIDKRQAAIEWRKIDLLWDDMILLLLKLKEYLATTLMYFLSLALLLNEPMSIFK